MTTNTSDRKRPTALGRVGQALAWVVILGATSAIAVAVLVPRVTGATPYTVLTSSMEPAYPPGTLVVVRPTPAEEIGIGSVITYQLESGREAVVTHRVVAIRQSSNGDLSFITQGDANDGPDLEPVRPVQVKGTVWYSVPELGWMSTALDPDQRNTVVHVLAAGLGLYALVMFGGGLRDRVRNRRDGSTTTPHSTAPDAGAAATTDARETTQTGPRP